MFCDQFYYTVLQRHNNVIKQLRQQESIGDGNIFSFDKQGAESTKASSPMPIPAPMTPRASNRPETANRRKNRPETSGSESSQSDAPSPSPAASSDAAVEMILQVNRDAKPSVPSGGVLGMPPRAKPNRTKMAPAGWSRKGPRPAYFATPIGNTAQHEGGNKDNGQ